MHTRAITTHVHATRAQADLDPIPRILKEEAASGAVAEAGDEEAGTGTAAGPGGTGSEGADPELALLLGLEPGDGTGLGGGKAEAGEEGRGASHAPLPAPKKVRALGGATQLCASVRCGARTSSTAALQGFLSGSDVCGCAARPVPTWLACACAA